MPKYITTLPDGREFAFDSPENQSKFEAEYAARYGTGKPQQQSTGQEFRPMTWEDKFRNTVGQYIPELAPAIGSIVGGGIGLGASGGTGGLAAVPFTAGGRAAGTVLGTGVKRGLRGIAPRLFGGNEPDVNTDFAKDVALNELFNIGGNVLAKGAEIFGPGTLKEKIFKNLIGSKLAPEDQAIVAKAMDEGKTFTVGEASGRPLVNLAENTLGRAQKTAIVNEATQQEIKNLPFKLADVQKVTREQVLPAYQATRKQLVDDTKAAYDAVDNIILKESPKQFYNPEDFAKAATPQRANAYYSGGAKPTATPKPVNFQYPVQIQKSGEFADTMVKELDRAIASESVQGIPGSPKDILTGLRNTIAEISNIKPLVKKMPDGSMMPAGRVVDYATLKGLKEELDNFIYGAWNDPVSNRLKATAKAEYSKVEQDILSSFASKPELAAAYSDAKAANIAKMSLLDNVLSKNLYKFAQAVGMAPEELKGMVGGTATDRVYKMALASPENTRLFLKLTQQGNAKDNPLSTYYLHQMFTSPTYVKEGSNIINAKAALDKFTADETRGILQPFMNATDRSNVKQLLKEQMIRATPPSNAANTALTLMLGRASIWVGGGLLTQAALTSTGSDEFTGSAGARTGALILGAAVAGKKFTEKILLNPKYARMAIQLAQQPQGTPRALELSKSILKALGKGTRVTLNTGTREIPATLDEKGNPVPDSQ